jgi:hypothetical protein
MVTERTIINALIIGASLILVPFIISSTLTVDFAPALFFGGLLMIVGAFFFFKDRLCVGPLLSMGIAGGLNFLPFSLQATHIAALLLILYYITGYVIIRQKRVKLGKPAFLWPILIITSILLYHNHALNVGVMGGDSEGGKAAILIYVIVLAYFCGINITNPPVDFLAKVPFYFLVCTVVSSIPFFITTFVPALAPYFYSVTGNVNVEAYVDAEIPTSSSGAVISRLGAFGVLGSVLQLYLLCYYPIGSWLRPERWWVAGLSILCVGAALASGYRSGLFDFALTTFLGACCYYSWRAIILPAGLTVLVLVFLVASTNNLINLPTSKLPLIAQRTLSFLPGEWSQDAIDSGESSNEFRKNIQDIYIKEYLSKSPYIGNGFTINTKVYDSYINGIAAGGSDPMYIQGKAFIEGKLFHTGWISVYDCVGIIGSLAFVALGWNEMLVSGKFVFGPKSDKRSSLFPLHAWLFCNIVTTVVAYFTVFGAFSDTFSTLCIYGLVLSQLSDIQKAAEIPSPLRDAGGPLDFVGLKGANYGYQGYKGYQSR